LAEPSKTTSDRLGRLAWRQFLEQGGHSLEQPVDSTDSVDGLLDWLEQARLVPAHALKALRAQALSGEFNGVAIHARELRE
jgi:hypothetical protein